MHDFSQKKQKQRTTFVQLSLGMPPMTNPRFSTPFVYPSRGALSIATKILQAESRCASSSPHVQYAGTTATAATGIISKGNIRARSTSPSLSARSWFHLLCQTSGWLSPAGEFCCTTYYLNTPPAISAKGVRLESLKVYHALSAIRK